MQADLETEKTAFKKQWAKREKQIGNIVTSTTGMYGELQALIGAALPEISKLELSSNLLDESENKNKTTEEFNLN